MSPHLHYEIARVRQNEIAGRTLHAHHAIEPRPTAGRSRRSVTSRVGQAVVAVGLGLAATAAMTVSGAFASPRLARSADHVSASQLSRDIHALEAKGYTPYQCMRKGTLMRNSRTGRFELVSW
jgi:hypothetical protein